MTIVRTAGKADISAVDALLARAYPRLLRDAYAPHVLVTAIPLISRVQPELVTSGRYYVVDGYQGVIGAGGWSPSRANADRAEVRHFVTDDRFVRQGVGRAILATAIAAARKAGCTSMHCMATPVAVPFYVSQGFRLIGPGEVTLRPGITLPIMELERSLLMALG